METVRRLAEWPRASAPYLAGVLGLALLLAACDRGDLPAPPPEEGLLTPEKSYANQKLDPYSRAQYRFHAEKRGAYLIMVYGNPSPLDITLRHPKRTCYLLGNGSCELVTGPDESYDFEVSSGGNEAVQFSLMVTHSDGTGRFDGQVSQPRDVEADASFQGSVGVHESSYYSFVPSRSGIHTIALTGTVSDLLWRLFDAPAFDVILQECNDHTAAADEACQTPPLHADMRYYVKVEERSGVPGPYGLAIFGP